MSGVLLRGLQAVSKKIAQTYAKKRTSSIPGPNKSFRNTDESRGIVAGKRQVQRFKHENRAQGAIAATGATAAGEAGISAGSALGRMSVGGRSSDVKGLSGATGGLNSRERSLKHSAMVEDKRRKKLKSLPKPKKFPGLK